MLCQVGADLNSRTLCSTSKHDEDGIKILTLGHFLVGQLHEAFPDLGGHEASLFVFSPSSEFLV